MSEISAQPHITLCIQFLNREKMTKTGKTDLFTIVWGCTETLPTQCSKLMPLGTSYRYTHYQN